MDQLNQPHDHDLCKRIHLKVSNWLSCAAYHVEIRKSRHVYEVGCLLLISSDNLQYELDEEDYVEDFPPYGSTICLFNEDSEEDDAEYNWTHHASIQELYYDDVKRYDLF